MILILSSPNDAHLPFVTKHLVSDFIVVDPWTVADGKGLSYELSNETRLSFDGRVLPAIKSVWLRKPRAAVDFTPNVPPEYLDYTRSALQRHFEQLYALLDNAFWLSDYYTVRKASNKAMQLVLARELGFTVPETLFTSDAEEARVFIAKHRHVVVKSPSTKWPTTKGGHKAFFTSRITAEQGVDLDGLHLAPAIFQQIIEPLFDVRVTVVGDQVFAAKVVLSEAVESTIVDWRIGHARGKGKLLFEAYDLPPGIGERCVTLTKRLNLPFGAIDFVCDKEGRLWFLEINPNGQWAFVEEATGQPVGKAIADLLDGRT